MDPRVALLFLAWGFAEATAAPIVPDVGLRFLALATPAALGLPLASAIAGGVIGALALVVLRQRRPDVVDRILAFQPGLGRPGWLTLAYGSQSAAVPRSAKSVPGLPLKAYVVAYLHDRPATGFVEIAGLAFLNRLTRVVPTVPRSHCLAIWLDRSIFPPVRRSRLRARMDPLLRGILVDPPARRPPVRAPLTLPVARVTLRGRSELQGRGGAPAWSSFLYPPTARSFDDRHIRGPTTVNTNKPTYLSRDGLEKLRAELEEMTSVKRPEVAQRIHDAKEHGDLSENAEYEDAKNEQAFVEGRIQTLEALIKNATIIDENHSTDHVQIGSTVEVQSPDGAESFTIVGSTEARPNEGRISNESPVGRALLGRKKGEKVVVKVPAGDFTYKIVSIS